MARVLLVEDEDGTRGSYTEIMSLMGHEVFPAANAEEARSIILSEEDLDVALVDRILPGQEDGLAILRFLQDSQPLCQAILVTGYPDFDSASEALRTKAFDYLTKPVRTEELSRTINAAVAEKTARERKILEAKKSREGFEALRSKQEILQHDMRSLLVGIIGFANLLMDKTALDATQMEYCKQIRRYGVQLENMVNTYLSISDLEKRAFQLEKTTFNLFEVIRQSRRTLQFLALEKNVEISIINNKRMFSIEDVLPFHGNRMYLQNALDNLVKNAIEASPPDGRVKLKIKDGQERLSISIHNLGIVPDDVLPIFFEKYVTSGKKNGLGVGTYMARLVIEEHGGDIGVSSSEDEGTEVLMTLPVSAPQFP
jgi:signal transduction histidine kinase